MPARKRRSLWWIPLVGLVAMASGGWWLWHAIGGDDTPGGVAVRVVVPKGATLRTTADLLARAKVIASPRLFRWYATTTGVARAIKPGAFALREHMSFADVLEVLVAGRAILHTVVIPEGFDVRGMTPLLSKVLNLDADSVRAAAADTAWRRRLNVPAPTLEGYLFPATYTFPEGVSAREVVQAMLTRFETVWRKEWDDRAQAMSISRHDAMTMASIIEKEARHPEERPIISAVYWNRVKKGMLLQADPTVQYALPQHVARVLYRDLEVDSKYNTYRYKGLPPGPIASPGEASIAAALAPANVPYLYFVARLDGHHEFRTTGAEHERAVAEVRQAARLAKSNAAKPAPKVATPK